MLIIETNKKQTAKTNWNASRHLTQEQFHQLQADTVVVVAAESFPPLSPVAVG